MEAMDKHTTLSPNFPRKGVDHIAMLTPAFLRSNPQAAFAFFSGYTCGSTRVQDFFGFRKKGRRAL